MAAEQQTTKVLHGNDPSTAIGKIVEYEFWLLKQGYAKTTIEGRAKVMRRFVKLGNPERRKIDFYAFRYWRATEEYDRSHKDFESVMYLLGHNSLRYVLLYKQPSRGRKHGAVDKYIVREAHTKKEEIELLEDGFE